MKISVYGLDLAKHVFHVVGLNQANKVVDKRKLRRQHVLAYFAQQEPTVVAMEACRGSHYWARELSDLGHEVKLLPPRAVKPFLQGQKNDYNDALAIAEASQRPKLHAVKVKTLDEQDLQSLHRLKPLAVRQRTQLCNQLRGLLSEYGVVIGQGITRLRRELAKLMDEKPKELTSCFQQLLAHQVERFKALDETITQMERRIVAHAKQHEPVQRLQSLPGFGPMVSSAYYSVIGDGKAFRCGREASASIGLVPRQHSSADKPILLGISKRGNSYLRSLLVHGARSVVNHAHKKTDPLSRWICQLIARRGKNKATVALANKLARIAWAMLRRGGVYDVRAMKSIGHESTV